ncbi:hypothetical protein ACH4A8_41160 [Streptomyces vietnamensis]|uniref:hypothetical protein n=1 Tax=Streptomyces vietnamensis TaxID=362257 RepID=UPI00379EDE53
MTDTPYGVTGCRCWPEVDGPRDGEWRDVTYTPNATCPYHGVLAPLLPDRRDTGMYAVVLPELADKDAEADIWADVLYPTPGTDCCGDPDACCNCTSRPTTATPTRQPPAPPLPAEPRPRGHRHRPQPRRLARHPRALVLDIGGAVTTAYPFHPHIYLKSRTARATPQHSYVMTLRQRTARNLRAHWKLAGIPIGILVNGYGNSLYGGPRHMLGLILFSVGAAIAIFGTLHLRRLVRENPLHEGTVNVYAGASLLACITVPGPVTAIIKGIDGTAEVSNYRGAAASLTLIYVMLPLLLRWFEPKDLLLQRLPGRIRRATIFRTVANAAGILAVAAFLKFRFGISHPAPIISTALTLLVAMTVVTHKTFARTRKLCTQIHIDVQTLLRDLEALDRARGNGATSKWNKWLPVSKQTDNKHADERMSAYRSWDTLKRDLSTTLDTGYRPIGLPFLMEDVIAELEKKMLDEINATETSAASPAHSDLQTIREACAGHIDVLS